MISVNLTTTSTRLTLCAATLYSLTEQTLRPDKIVLRVSHDAYLADEGLPGKEAMGPVARIAEEHDNIQIEFVKNTGPYRKLLPALEQAEDDDIIVYADDDVVYGPNWLKGLSDVFDRYHQESVVASRVRSRTKSITGQYKGYLAFPVAMKEGVVNEPIITGVGGAILKKRHIKAELLDNNDYLEVAPKTDDLWISKLIELSGTKVIACPEILSEVMQIEHSSDSLNSMNNTALQQASLVMKLLSAVYHLILIQLGYSKSNNDISLRAVDAYFDSR